MREFVWSRASVNSEGRDRAMFLSFVAHVHVLSLWVMNAKSIRY